MTIREVPCHETTTRVFVAFYGTTIPIGFMTVDDLDDLIEMVYVDRRHRRQGVATALLAEARRATGLRLDADRGDRTLDGSRWCRANGISVGSNYRRMSAGAMWAQGARMMSAIHRATMDEQASA